jgi:SAM-dependent methyltransferase
MDRRAFGTLLAVNLFAPAALRAQTAPIDGGPFVATPMLVVEEMLKLAEVGAKDVVYDLGSGDGRLVIEAARRGARGVGVEREARLVELSRAEAAKAGVADRVRFVQGDIFNTNLSEATVVTLYLLPVLLERLAPKLRAELPVGARVVSHDFPLDWPAERMRTFEVEEKARNMGFGTTQLFLYRMRLRID